MTFCPKIPPEMRMAYILSIDIPEHLLINR